jgi:transmembrane sensor
LKQDDFEKIERYIKGESDYNERKYMESLFLEGENKLYFRNRLYEDWQIILEEGSSFDLNLNYLLDHIHHIIWKNETRKRQQPMQKLVRIYVKAAAILLVPLMVAGGLIYRDISVRYHTVSNHEVTSTIYAPMGSRVSFKLPDGTTGILNSGSSLTYSPSSPNTRHIKLEGEAWFDVTHKEDHPFEIIVGNNSSVKVLGTILNLSAYPAENFIEIVLQKGKVEFVPYEGKDKGKVIMNPSERLVFRNGNVAMSVVDPSKYIGWTEGKLVFRGDPMAEVARRIERWYNVKINLTSNELNKYSFRATFQDDKLEDVLKFLSMTSPISYQILPSQLLPDGTFKKEEVNIYKRNR